MPNICEARFKIGSGSFSAWAVYNRECGYFWNGNGGTGTHTIEFRNINLAAGQRYTNKSTTGAYTIIDKTGPIVDGTHSWTGNRGLEYEEFVCEDLGCLDSNDCAPNEKCVNGVCVPCENEAATHFRFRFEYSSLTTFSDATVGMYHETPPIPITSLTPNFVINSPDHGQHQTWVRVIPCNSLGAPRLYKGQAAFWVNDVEGIISYDSNIASGWKVLGPVPSKAVFGVGFYSKITVEDCDQSDVIVDPDCGQLALPYPPLPPELPPVYPVTPLPPIEPPPLPPTELPPEPTEPTPWPEPWTPPYTPPTKPTQPEIPEESLQCECRDYFLYIAQAILKIVDVFHDGILALYDISKLFFDLLVSLINKIIDSFNSLNFNLYSLGLYAVQTFKEESEKNRQNLKELFSLPPCEPDYPNGKTITRVIEEIKEKYEPALVEVLESEVVINQDNDRRYSRNNLT